MQEPLIEERICSENLRLNELEYRARHIHLQSFPRCLGIVLGNACNIRCPHCYQSKNGDNLLRPPEIARDLRREFMSFYPYLATLRLQGGEVFAMAGFQELLEDVANTTRRPIVSVSTNGTLIDEKWAEKIVRMPFATLTVSIDGGTPETYARMRQGADLESVLANVRRVQSWKTKLGSALPYLDSFFVIMRSNFREIPRYLEIMRQHGIGDVALQTVEINAENSSREPDLARREVFSDATEVAELHALLRDALAHERPHFRMIRVSGLTSLFEQNGLDIGFLEEAASGLYPDSDQLVSEGGGGFELCPNPWTTLFVAENGGVHLCFLSEPIGNLYETPLSTLWNSPRAVAKRSQMIRGQYTGSGCSSCYCSWRDGQASPGSDAPVGSDLVREIRELNGRMIRLDHNADAKDAPWGLGAVRRMLSARDTRIAQLETMFLEYDLLLEKGQKHIDTLESRNSEYDRLLHGGQARIDAIESQRLEYDRLLEAGQKHIDALQLKSDKAVADFQRLDDELRSYRQSSLVRAARKVSRALVRLT